MAIKKYYIPYTACLVKKKTPFQGIEIYKSIPYGKIMLINGYIQAAEKDEYRFHEALVHPAFTAHPSPRHVLILGLGPGAVAREVLRYSAVQTLVGIDIDPMMITLAKKHLPEWSCGAFEDKRLKVEFMDAKAYLEQSGPLFDVIIANFPDPAPKTPLEKLYTSQFYKEVRRRLKAGGIFVTQANAFFPKQHDNGLLVHIHKNVASVFEHTQVYGVWVDSFQATQAMLIASQQPLYWNKIDQILEERGIRNVRFYCKKVHGQMFSCPSLSTNDNKNLFTNNH